MLVLTNLILCTTTTPHNDTSNQNNANGTHNISYNTSSKNSFTFDNKTLGIHEIIGDTKKEIENHTLITRELMQDDPELHKKPKDKQLLFGVKRRGEISIGGSITPDEKWKSDEDDVLDFNKQREIDDAADLGLSNMKELIEVKEPMWYGLGLVLDQNDPATHVANFGRPNRKALALSQFGYAALEASSQISKSIDKSYRAVGIFREGATTTESALKSSQTEIEEDIM
ncbi:hypothetical protein HHI36_015236 [Cryptolaemus montrouzieri]|uniref:Uncharacterized protein n=1 Tax=Cryptolaemus montrouzieri TaxID=559131 RepID=A0ABD2N500_9CUCU